MIKNCSTHRAVNSVEGEACPFCANFNTVEAAATSRNMIGRGVLAGLLALSVAAWLVNWAFDHDTAVAKLQQEETAQREAIAAKAAVDTALTISTLERPGWCDKATTHVERIICTDNDLSELDVRMQAIYKASKRRAHDSKHFDAVSRAWKNIQRDACSTKNCLIKAYQLRIHELTARPSLKPVLSALTVQELSPTLHPTLVEIPEPDDVVQESGV